MGIFNWFTKKEKLNEIPETADKWIYISFVAYYDGKLKKKEVNKIAENMAMIVLNTQAVFSLKNEFQGCINPYLNIDALMTYDGGKEWTLRKISRAFVPIVNKEKDKWKITLTPLKENGKQNLYSLPNLFYDMFILAQANKWILEKCDILRWLKPTAS